MARSADSQSEENRQFGVGVEGHYGLSGQLVYQGLVALAECQCTKGPDHDQTGCYRTQHAEPTTTTYSHLLLSEGCTRREILCFIARDCDPALLHPSFGLIQASAPQQVAGVPL